MTFVNEILPLLIIPVASYAAKRAGAMTASDGSALMRVVIYLGVPALIFLSLMQVDLNGSTIGLSLVAPVVVGLTLATLVVLRRTALRERDPAVVGPIVAGSVIMNTGFLLPFVERIAGIDGIARLMIIDTIVGVMIYSVIYLAVVRTAHDRPDTAFVLKRVLILPPLWAVVAALVLRPLGITPAALVMDSLEMAAGIVSIALLVALGLMFELRIRLPRLLALTIGLRFGLGAVLGLALITVLGLDGLDASIALLACLAPPGFNTIALAELEGLDTEFAAAIVSTGIVIAVLALPATTALLR